MLSTEAIRTTLKAHSKSLHDFGVSELWLFGSAVREPAEARDLDFLVQFSSRPGLVNFMELKFFLEELFKLPVDLHSRTSCPKRFLKRIEPDLKHVA